MEDVLRPAPKRRTLLQRGLALFAGAVGLGAAGTARGDIAPVLGLGSTLKLYGRRRPLLRVAKGGGPTAGSHVVSSGDLLEERGGRAVGSFHTNGLCLETPLGPTLPAESNIEFQTRLP